MPKTHEIPCDALLERQAARPTRGSAADLGVRPTRHGEKYAELRREMRGFVDGLRIGAAAYWSRRPRA